MKSGVKWFSNIKGHGFIEYPLTDGKDIFVHYSVIQQEGFKTLEDGQEVQYDVAVGPKGEHATVVFPATFDTEAISA